MGHRNKNGQRCGRCKMRIDCCLCAHLPRLSLRTKIALVMHVRESKKPTATGPMALCALPNHELFLHGQRDARADLRHLNCEGRKVLLLFPHQEARVLCEADGAPQAQPLTLVVPDGNWGQAARMSKRLWGMENAERVTLPPGPETEWGVRRESRPGGLATFEAISRALGIVESAAVQQQLEGYFRLMVETTFAMRGASGLSSADVDVEADAARGQGSL